MFTAKPNFVLPVTLLLAMIIGCDNESPSIRDTVSFKISFDANEKPYSLDLKPGLNEGDQYTIYGNQIFNGNFEIQALQRYITFDKPDLTRLTIGLTYSPEKLIRTTDADRCQQLEKESDKYLTTGSYPLCSSPGGNGFLFCSNSEDHKFLFQIEYKDKTGRVFRSGLSDPDAYFTLNKIQKLEYIDKHTHGYSFDWLIEGEFSATLYLYQSDSPSNPDGESVKISNGKFKMGMKNLCFE